jgi:hypothetical protein
VLARLDTLLGACGKEHLERKRPLATPAIDLLGIPIGTAVASHEFPRNIRISGSNAMTAG